ncbi:MAG: HAMP domain-containing histidine kinase [Chitinophagaceae bacterium]|nr:HAMP domain-containing histidine kinase [Oligoflexus sp.]
MAKSIPTHKIAFYYFVQTVALGTVLSIFFGAVYIIVQSRTDSEVVRWGFGFLSVLCLGLAFGVHAHWLLIRPLHKLQKSLSRIDIETLANEDLLIFGHSQLDCEFAELDELFHALLNKLQYRHREVLLTKNDLARLNRGLEAELDLRRHQLESRMGASFQQNKLNALGEMAAGIAHEINNPLAILVGRTEQLRTILAGSSGHIPSKQDSILSSMEKTLFRIQEAVLDLELIASSPKHEDIRPIPLSRLVKRLNKVVSNRYQTREIEFEPQIENDVEIEGREVELTQAILYLLENASEAAQSNDGRRKWVRVVLQKNSDESCFIAITDSGFGVAENLRVKLFQPFFSTKDESRGMGLTLAKAVIESHGGTLSFDFSYDNTTVRLHLPRRQIQTSVA